MLHFKVRTRTDAHKNRYSTGGIICSPCHFNFKDVPKHVTTPIPHPLKCHACKNYSHRPAFPSDSISAHVTLQKYTAESIKSITWLNKRWLKVHQTDRQREKEKQYPEDWFLPTWTAFYSQSSISPLFPVFMHMEDMACFD